MNQPSFDQLPEMVSKILEKVELLEELLLEQTINKNDQEEMLNIKDAAVFLGLSVPTLYSKVSRKEIPYHKPGKRLYFQKSELLDWIKSTVIKAGITMNLHADKFFLPKSPRHARRLR